MKKIIHLSIIIVVNTIFCICLITGMAYGLIKPGDDFPEMDFDLTIYKTAPKYLGIKKAGSINMSEIDADILIIEVMSVYCVSCMSQSPYDRELFSMIEENGNTAGKVKMIGIGAGNNIREVHKFVEEFNVPFPVFPDFDFSKYNQIGQVRTPFKIYLVKQPNKKFQIIKTEQGVRENVKETFETIVRMLEGKYAADQKIASDTTEVKPINQDLVDQLLTEWLNQRGEASKIKRLFEDSGIKVFQIGSKDDIFALLINRVSTCDVCKEVKFIYLIDKYGNVLDLIPIQLSKLYNESFNETDIAKIKTRLISRNVREYTGFNPAVDAITSATITSGLIYDSINMGAKIYERLLEKGFID